MMCNVMVTAAGPGGMLDELRHPAWPPLGQAHDSITYTPKVLHCCVLYNGMT